MSKMWRNHSKSKADPEPPSAAPEEQGSGRGSSDGAASGDAAAKNAKLPPGWTKKESKSQKGKYYYISPSGKTQWTPPIVGKKEKAQVQYNWVHEIEIEFGEGRLGVSLREVRQIDSIPYPQFQAEVDDLPKINGKAGPAELYNWSVKPHQRLTIGMRITFIEGTSLAGFTYKEIVDKLKRAQRPVKLRFADVDQATIEENPDALKQKEQPDKTVVKKSKYLEQKHEYTRVLVNTELHTELWSIETKKLDRQLARLKKKWDTVSSEFDALNGHRVDLQKDHDKLLDDKQKYTQMIKQLKLQETHEIGNPEFIKANDLAKKHAELTEDISRMGSGNKRLRKERITQQTSLDELESALAKLGKVEDEDKNDDDIFFGLDPSAPPKDQLAAIRKRMRFMDDELIKEQRKAAKVEKEMEQLNRHLTKLSAGSSSSSSSGRGKSGEPKDRDSATPNKSSSSSSSSTTTTAASSSSASELPAPPTGRSSELPKDAAGLEIRIGELRKMQRQIVSTMSKAAEAGDKETARECQKKRKLIKDELGRAQDALNLLKAAREDEERSFAPSRGGAGGGGGAGGRSDSSTSRKQQQLPKTMSAQEMHASSHSSSSKKKQQPPPGPPVPEAKIPTLNGFLEKGPTEWSERGLIRGMKTMRGARERWCEITEGGYLRYYKRRGDPVVRGEIDLSDSSFEVTCEDMQRGKEFLLCTSDQQSHFFTKTNEEQQKWVKTLRAANAFLKTNKHLDALAGKLDAADRRHGGAAAAGRGMPEEEEQYYGRATLGF